MAQEKRKNERTLIILLVGLVITLVSAFFFLMLNPPSRLPAAGAARVYFIRNEKLYPAEKGSLAGEKPERAALISLLSGPSAEEKEKGILSHVPKGVKILGMSKENGTVFVNLSKELDQVGAGAEKVRSMIAQIVYTLTDIPGVARVRILVDGSSDVVLGGEGYIIDKPLTKKDITL